MKSSMKRGNFRDDGDNRNVDLDLYDRDDGLASGKNYAFGEQQDVLRGMLERLRESVFDRLDARKVEWSSHEEFSDNKQMYVMLFDLVASEMDFLFEGIAYASRIILLTELAEYAAVTRPIKRSVSSLFSLMRVVQSRFLSRTADKAGAIALHSFAYTQFFLHTHTILHRHPYLRAIASNRHAFVNSTHPLLRNALRSIGYLRAQARGLAPSTHEHCDQILEALGHVYKFINQHNTRKDFPRGSGAGDNVLGISNEHVWDRLAIQEAYARAIPGARVADAFSKEDMDAVVEAFRALQVLMLDHKHSIEHDQDTRPKLFGQTFVDLKNPSDEEDVWEVGVDKDTVTARLLRCYAGPLEASGVFDAAGGGGDTLLHKKGTLPYHMYRFLDHLYNVADMADTSANFVQMLDIPDDETYTFFRPSPVPMCESYLRNASSVDPKDRLENNFSCRLECKGTKFALPNIHTNLDAALHVLTSTLENDIAAGRYALGAELFRLLHAMCCEYMKIAINFRTIRADYAKGKVHMVTNVVRRGENGTITKEDAKEASDDIKKARRRLAPGRVSAVTNVLALNAPLDRLRLGSSRDDLDRATQSPAFGRTPPSNKMVGRALIATR